MKNAIICTVLVMLLLPTINYACSCLPAKTFCEDLVDINGAVFPDLILRGEVMQTIPGEWKKVKVGQVIYGQINQDEIEILNWQCVLNYQGLEEGEEFIIALNSSGDDFLLVGCAISFLKIENERVRGKIAPGINAIDYKDLHTVMNCGNAFDFISFKGSMTLFPNPSSGEVKLKNSGTQIIGEELQVNIFNLIGKELSIFKREEEMKPGEIWELNLDAFSSGVYLIKISDKYKETTFKVLKI